ncbi:MAG TPA: stage II sporulation protein M [Planctomycetota bacterium]|nr:stage II sporulation protein M [Planctomycetota bacterium]
MGWTREEGEHLRRLGELIERGSRRSLRRLSGEELAAFGHLYRFASSLHARLETGGEDGAVLERTRRLVGRAHSILFSDLGRSELGFWARARRLLLVESPRTLRAEWRLLTGAFALVYGLALLAWFAVRADLGLAFSLFQPEAIAQEIAQLQATTEGEPFRGNFTFGIGRSPQTAGWIMAHNMGVAVILFAAGLIPPFFLYVLGTNGLMLGAYTAVAAHWDQAGAISSILWCHGALEIQAIVLAGLAGMVLVRAWIAPGPWSRAHAMQLESARAWRILAPVFPMLFVAGVIEGFVSPHAPTPVRIATALFSGGVFLAWWALGGRGADAPARARDGC